MNVVRIAVTGGPCAGKTTVLKACGREYGEQILVPPEAASLLLDHGFPRPGQDVSYGDRWMRSFQNAVLPLQLNMENEYLQMCIERMTRVLLFDRGVLDGAAYLGLGLDYFAEAFELDLDEVYARYDLVIHLESVAASDPALYQKLKATNPARYEDAEVAAELDFAIREAWQGHPNWVLISSAAGINLVTQTVLELLSEYLENEIEAKFWLPDGLPNIELPLAVPVEQFYLPLQVETRLRRMGEAYYATFKGKGTHTRKECERSIDRWVFDALRHNELPGIQKARFFVPFNDRTLEIDEFYDALTGLVTFECEFGSLGDLRAFKLPSWAAGAIDVTADTAFKNHSLAYDGLPERVKAHLRG